MEPRRVFCNRPPLQTFVEVESHPSIGNGKPYPKEIREMIMRRHILGLPRLDENIRLLQLHHKYPSNRTIQRWITRYNLYGHYLPFRRTGNNRATRELRGLDLSDLALIRAVLPKSRLYEVKAFVFSANPINRPYSNSQLYRAESLIGLSRKAASTTSHDAHLPINLVKREQYWNAQYPFGIAGIDPRTIIDCDEMGLELEHQNRSFGKTAVGERCDQKGVYNRNEKLNVLMAVVGCDVIPSRWSELWTGEGTTLYRFYHFIERIVNDINERFPGQTFTFTMDNLNVHKNPLVIGLILNGGHQVVFRAPYWAVDGAIEYIFNSIHTLLEVLFDNIADMEELILCVENIMASMPSFRPYLQHVGFRYE